MAHVHEAIARKQGIDRRDLLKAAGATAVAGALLGHGQRHLAAQGATPVASPVGLGSIAVNSIVDLTHVWSPTFPVFAGAEYLSEDIVYTVAEDGYYVKRLHFEEHTGTHLDAPAHFIEGGATADVLPIENFFAPIVVVDISAKASQDADAAVTVDDLMAWEAEYGPLPERAFVAMYSGWESRIAEPDTYVNLDGEGVQHYPGFDPEAAAFLVEERDIVGIGVDTLSQDPGISEDFGTHVTILGAGKYAVENVANLAMIPPVGATVIVGGPKHEAASGGPTRLFAAF
jgi:kynurenine formamidase